MQSTSSQTWANIQSALYDFDAIESARSDYSGRAMYGKECVGFVTDNPFYLAYALTTILKDLAEDETYDDLPDMDDLASRTRTDNMGRSTIVYWPSWQIED